MANHLKMALAQTILSLHELGWSAREIARELGVHRETVGRHIRLAGASKPATGAPTGSKPASCAPAGSVGESEALPPGGGGFIALRPTAGGDSLSIPVAEDRATLGSDPSAATGPYGTGGLDSIGAARSNGGGKRIQPSRCEPYRQAILDKLAQGLTAQRIYQDLTADNGFAGSYYSVRRFVSRLAGARELPFRRMECRPGAQCQVDFGKGAPIVADGRRRKSHVFRTVLGYSRKGYSEAAERQTTDDFLLCLENAFWSWGGVPRMVIIDNLKAAVTHPDWYDPELNPKVRSFCEHYGTAILPTRPYTPRHKGKVERGVGYVQDNGLKGRQFESFAAENRHLQDWEATVADTRIHGTTRRQVGKVFLEVEKPALLPLPAGRFPFFHEAQRSVHRDGHVEVQKAYYSVPPEYMGRTVWVRWDGRMVRVFNRRMEQIAVHAQRREGQFSTQDRHINSRKVSAVERGTDWLLRRVSLIGEHAEKWAAAMLLARGVAGVRVLVGLMSLTHRHDSPSIERACRIALTHQAFHLRAVRELIKRGGNEQEEFDFLQQHEIIRDLSSYGHIARAAIRGEPVEPQPVEY